jgi:hypothetical protein
MPFKKANKNKDDNEYANKIIVDKKITCYNIFTM